MKLALSVVLIPFLGLAQTKTPVKPEPAKTELAVKDLTQPEMTDHEKDRLDVDLARITEINTRTTAQANQEAEPFINEAAAIIKSVEAKNPGWQWHVAAGPNDRTGWQPKPKPAPQPVPTDAAKPPVPAAPTVKN
jgi:hypothetical protein